ncbi:MAG: HAMP domain-containing sensor histidine kinase [Planctomycetota bacterium]|nr:HAMP domain-containing sensor histidine kinase [Planctomycetota bacterium]
MLQEMLELESGQLMLIGIGLALVTIVLVGLGYSAARIVNPGPPPGSKPSGPRTEPPESTASGSIPEMQDELLRTEGIRHVAARVIHDFNNMVFAISGRIQILRYKVTDEEVLKSLAEMESALDSSQGIFGALTRINQDRSDEQSELLIEPEVQAISAVVRALAPPDVEVTLQSTAPEGTRVRMTRNTLQQVLTSLLANAVEAIGDGPGRIAIALGPAADDDPDTIVLSIDDDGPGIKPEDRATAFTTFYSGRKTSPVAGLGLSISKRLLEEHGAGIQLGDSPLGGLRVETRILTIRDDS